MTRITRCADCGNSPKNKLVEDLAIAIETGAAPREVLADHVRWHGIEGTVLTGRDAVADVIAERAVPRGLAVERVISHGKAGSALGRVDGRSFAHFFEFASTTARAVVRIDSFSKAER